MASMKSSISAPVTFVEETGAGARRLTTAGRPCCVPCPLGLPCRARCTVRIWHLAARSAPTTRSCQVATLPSSSAARVRSWPRRTRRRVRRGPIDETAWTPIRYPNAVWDDEEQRWVSDAEVAEVAFTAFTGRRQAEHVTARLIVRRVRRLNPASAPGAGQGELFTAYRYHACLCATRRRLCPDGGERPPSAGRRSGLLKLEAA